MESLPEIEAITYRAATMADAAEVARLGRMLYRELHYSDVAEYDQGATAGLLRHLAGEGLLLVAVDAHDDVIGFLGYNLMPVYFSPGTEIAQEIFWWVDEAHRSAGVGEALLQMAENDAAGRGARAFCSMLNEHARRRGVGPFLERKGYRAVETTYLKELH